ncbi:Fic family protein [Candidatus Woesearchaeota archaeon]|nr:Fic family protein [Candidatus Woesearchaeota archaeon]
MVYIHVKKIGNKKYYSLRISVRKENRVITKDLCNLGSDISKINLDNLEKKYKKEIRKSYKTIKKFLDTNYYIERIKKVKKSLFFTKEQLINIEAILLHYRSKFLKLNRLTKKETYNNFLIKFAVNSTAIEGNTITLKEARKLFEEDVMPKNRTLREAYDLINTKKVFNFLLNKKPKLDIDLIIKIHDMLLDKTDKRKGLRNHDIHILGQPFKPSPARYVKSDIRLLLEWYNKNKNIIYPLALAIFFHHKFESIHPFSDGNGRTGRVLMNYILSLHNYPPLVISIRSRKEYLDLLNQADKSLKKNLLEINKSYYQDLINFIYSQYKLSYWDTFLF